MTAPEKAAAIRRLEAEADQMILLALYTDPINDRSLKRASMLITCADYLRRKAS